VVCSRNLSLGLGFQANLEHSRKVQGNCNSVTIFPSKVATDHPHPKAQNPLSLSLSTRSSDIQTPFVPDFLLVAGTMTYDPGDGNAIKPVP
jgi:hypothetical protein